jgi:hypothetical protein
MDIILPDALWNWYRPSLSQKYVSGIFAVEGGKVKAAGAWSDNLATFICRLPRNFGSFNLLERKGPVQFCREISFTTSERRL